ANADIDTDGQGIHPTASFMQLGFLDVNMTLQKFELHGHMARNLVHSGSGTIFFANIPSATPADPTITGAISSEVDISVDDNAGFGANFLTGAHNYEVNFSGVPLGPTVSSIPGSGD